MANIKQRNKALQDICMYFAEKGKVLTQREYIEAEDKPVPFSGIRNVFRSYSRMISMLERAQPDLYALIGKKEEPKPAPVAPKPAPVAPKVAPTPKPTPAAPKVTPAAVKPAPAVKTEK